MAKQIIIATHAALSEGFKSSLDFIFGGCENLYTIEGFTKEKDPGIAFDKLIANFESDDKVIVLTDLSGGSVNKLIAERLANKKFYLISGINFALLLEMACADENTLDDEFIRSAIARCKEDMRFMNDAILETDNQDDEDSFLDS